ncbi:tRNA dimethylallyltransferase [compost metagenome]
MGYRQVWEEMDWQTRRGGELNLHLLREKGIAATRQLAKRQITWLRSMPQRQVIACDQAGATADLVQAVLQHLAESKG